MKNNKDNQNQDKSENQRQGVKKAKAGTKRRWVILLLVIAALMVSGLVAKTIKRNTGSDISNSGTFTVRRDNLPITVTEGGSIRAHKSIQYKCQVERRGGDVTILDIVPAGTYVTQEDVDNGMVLVKLDSSALEDRLTQEKMSLASDQANYTAAQEAYEIQKIDNESAIADSDLNVRFALLDLQKYLGSEPAEQLIKDVNEASNLTEYITPFIDEVRNDPNILAGSAAGQELKRLQDNIVLAEGNLKTAEDTLAGTRKLHDANYVSDLELQRDELNLQNRQFALESAKISLDLLMDYDFPKDTEQYLSDYIEAGRRLQRTQAQCRSRLAQAQAQLSMAESRFQEQAEQVKELEQQIEYCIIKARAPGLAVYGTGGESDFYRAMRGRGGGSGVIAEGEVVSEGQVIISMPDTASMVAEISVHETEVDKVRPGQPATIVMDAFPDGVLRGEVLEVAPLPDQQRGWLNPDLKVYQTLVRIDGTHDFLRSRMSCKVNILVEQLEDSIIVPIQVVSNRSGRKVCYVATSQGSQERVVQTGFSNDIFVQILEGLEVGEEVLLNPPLFTELTGPVAFQQQQPLPQRRTGPGTTDMNDTETQGRPDDQTRRIAGQFGDADREGTRRVRPPEDGESPRGEGPPQARQFQFELTDEMIERIMGRMAQMNPEKAKELEQLRKSDPEKFKAELMTTMRSMMRQGRRGMKQEPGDAEDRQNR